MIQLICLHKNVKRCPLINITILHFNINIFHLLQADETCHTIWAYGLTFSQSQMRLFHFAGGPTTTSPPSNTIPESSYEQLFPTRRMLSMKTKVKVRPIGSQWPSPLWEPPTSTPITVPVRKAKGEVRVRLRIRTGIRFRTCT